MSFRLLLVLASVVVFLLCLGVIELFYSVLWTSAPVWTAFPIGIIMTIIWMIGTAALDRW